VADIVKFRGPLRRIFWHGNNSGCSDIDSLSTPSAESALSTWSASWEESWDRRN